MLGVQSEPPRPAHYSRADRLRGSVADSLWRGGGDDSSSGKIAGDDTGATASASPSVSASADGINRPEIKLPDDMKMVFEGRQTGDAGKDAILADNARAVSTVWQAMAYGDLKKSGMGFYCTGTALTGVYDYAKNNIARNIRWAGTRYYDRQVTVFDKTSAAVTYCVDQSQADLKGRKTNKLQGTKTSSDSYVYYTQAGRRTRRMSGRFGSLPWTGGRRSASPDAPGGGGGRRRFDRRAVRREGRRDAAMWCDVPEVVGRGFLPPQGDSDLGDHLGGAGGTGGDLPNGTFATTTDVPVHEIPSVNR
ncbi:hypothetical protein GCM10027074_50860 [Streptomyces deserti]